MYLTNAFSFCNLYRHYHACRKNKRGTINALKFELDAENQLYQLSLELQNKSYHPSPAVCFVLNKPKLREIIAADFRDRVVHYVLVEHLENIYEPKFIYDSYACRKNKGVHKAVNRLQQFIGILNSKPGITYYLQLDIKSFFLDIDRGILMRLIKKHVSDEDMLWLADKIINLNITDNYVLRGDKRLFNALPDYKSLIKSSKNTGLPIGNLTSQFLANLYLNELDQYVKHNLKCKHYIRYCDDFILLGKDKESLLKYKDQIISFLRNNLRLELNSNYGDIKLASNGIDFLGYVTRNKYQLVRNRVITNLLGKLAYFKGVLVNDVVPGKIIYHYDINILENLRSTLSSYWGHFIHANSYKLRLDILKKNIWLNEYFELKAALLITNLSKFIARYQIPKLWNKVADQYNYCVEKYAKLVVLFEVGQYIEFYNEPSTKVLALLRLTKLKVNKRGALYGFPKSHIATYKDRLEGAGYMWINIRESGNIICGIKERLPFEKLIITA